MISFAPKIVKMIEKIKSNIFLILLFALAAYAIGRYLYKKPNVINGETAPKIVSTQRDGTPFDLSSLKGKYVVLDFWGSWCGPCLDEAPALKALNDKYLGKKFTDATSFEMVGVGIEKDRDRWLAAIEQLGIGSWIHVSDFQNLDSPLAKAYGVRVIPTKFLLNTEGVIIGVNPSIADIEKVLDSKVLK
jgi:thiol-disulfide isomerase/thioredoxin